MISFGAWLAETDPLSPMPRAVAAWRRIQDKPTSVVFRPPTGAALAAQTVRLEWDDGVSEAQSAAGTGPVRKLVVFGVRDHPTVATTNLGVGYRFVYQQQEYRIVDVIDTLGERQAIAEKTG